MEIFSKKITEVLDIMAPIKTIQARSNYSPWLSEDTKNLMKQRDETQRLASETQKQDDWRRYKSLRNTVNNRLKNEKSSWQKNKLETCQNDPGKLWKNILGCLLYTSPSPRD